MAGFYAAGEHGFAELGGAFGEVERGGEGGDGCQIVLEVLGDAFWRGGSGMVGLEEGGAVNVVEAVLEVVVVGEEACGVVDWVEGD